MFGANYEEAVMILRQAISTGVGYARAALRRRRGWISLAALIVLNALAPAASAQSSDEDSFVSNLEYDRDGLGWRLDAIQPGFANVFTTGAVAEGYQVTGVRIWNISSNDIDFMGLVVSLHKTNGNQKPTDRIGSFTRSKPWRNGWNGLVATEPIYAEPNSNYALVIECVSDCGGDNYMAPGRTFRFGQDGDPGWSIADVSLGLTGTDSTIPSHWETTRDEVQDARAPLLMMIRGYAANVFVSNESTAGDANGEVLKDGSEGFAEEFTTGNHGPGYLLDGVTVHAENSRDSGNIGRSPYIYTVNEDGSRKDLFVALNEQGGPRLVPPEWVRFEAPANTRLLPGERYMFVLECDSGCGGDNFITFTASSSPDQSSLIDEGWTIGDHVTTLENGWRPTNVDRSMWMRVWGRFDDRPYLVDGGVAITSTPRHTGAGDTYVRGDEIEFTLTFNEAVDVSGTPGSPSSRTARSSGPRTMCPVAVPRSSRSSTRWSPVTWIPMVWRFPVPARPGTTPTMRSCAPDPPSRR